MDISNETYTCANSLTEAWRKMERLIWAEVRHQRGQYCAPQEDPEVIGPVLYHYPWRNQYRLRATVRTGEMYRDLTVDDLNKMTIVVGQ